MISPFLGGEEEIHLATLAARKRVHPSTVHRWRMSGKLDCYRLGGRWLVTIAAWERFVCRCNGGAETAGDRSPRTPAQRKRDEEEATRRCIALGC